MLDELQKQGWCIAHDEDGSIVISACFDEGYWSYVTIWPNEAFKTYFRANQGITISKDGGVTDEDFVITSVTLHRLTDSYNHVVGKTADFTTAVQIAYKECQEWVKQFDGFCDD